MEKVFSSQKVPKVSCKEKKGSNFFGLFTLSHNQQQHSLEGYLLKSSFGRVQELKIFMCSLDQKRVKTSKRLSMK